MLLCLTFINQYYHCKIQLLMILAILQTFHRKTFLSLKVETLTTYHIGESILSLQKATLIPGGSESLVYTTLAGGIGMLVPFTSREVSFP